MKSIHLKHWRDRVKILMYWFQDLTTDHIFREFNDVADSLSKLALDGEAGVLHQEEWEEDALSQKGSMWSFDDVS